MIEDYNCLVNSKCLLILLLLILNCDRSLFVCTHIIMHLYCSVMRNNDNYYQQGGTDNKIKVIQRRLIPITHNSILIV